MLAWEVEGKKTRIAVDSFFGEVAVGEVEHLHICGSRVFSALACAEEVANDG